ncbi:hypothetical protein [Pseudalkalibacillus sp. SCS-8]|uniref:hypothetical protein n=1 Tax=Pseudalkalibacillus nanhaiensis TaxID=3115291 RepID=UPI0032DA5C01
MRKLIMAFVLIGLLFTGTNYASASDNPHTYGPYYTTFKGYELTSANWGTLAYKCKNAVYDYGSSISSSYSYTCKWYQVIERRVTTTYGYVKDVTYSPYYIYN